MSWKSWLVTLRALVFGSGRLRSRRPPRRTRLGVECLEAREVLSGGVTPVLAPPAAALSFNGSSFLSADRRSL